ncbi:MAG: ATP-binding protein [Euryarchaeota archaeon]|nr:ATP-binding protein [Euryarchaeota archaeon]
MKVLGSVVGTRDRPNTPDRFYFWIPEEEGTIEIGSIIKVDAPEGPVLATVEEMLSYSDVDDFLLHQLSRGGVPDAVTPSREQTVAVCRARTLSQPKDRPLREGQVQYPTEEELRELFHEEDSSIPIGVFRNTDGIQVPVKLDEDYLLGVEGAHVNISGMSGLGTKTSSFLFFLSSILTHSRHRVACVIFNVKSDDLMYIDRPSRSLEEADLERYRVCGIEPRGFNARFFAPAGKADGHPWRDDVAGFRWGYSEIERFIPSLLRSGSQDQQDKLDTAFYELKRMARARGIDSLSQLLDFIQEELLPENRSGGELVRGSYKATWGKLYNQLKGLESKYDGLVTPYRDEVVELPYSGLEDRDVWVIDIHDLAFYPRKLVFEKVITDLSERLESGALGVDRLIIFMDELNKYAPSQAPPEVASLKAKLVDITARGRSIGLSLFGAEQFKSKLDQNIAGNISTDIYGKTKEAELMEPIYGKFTQEIKGKIRRFEKDDKLIDHELFNAPVFVKVPRPPCALGSMELREELEFPGELPEAQLHGPKINNIRADVD